MHRTSERYRHQRQEEQGRDDGYDEDWDDDVYYAAASRPGKLGVALLSKFKFGQVSALPRPSVSDTTSCCLKF